ncbi:MAG: ABC transporter ATP-binding protein [Planctomycetota bacterium]
MDRAAAEGASVDLPGYGAVYLGLTLAFAFCVWAFIWLAGRIRTALSHDIRRDGFDNLQRLPFSFYDRRPVGWLMTRMTSDCERLSNILAWGVLDFFWGLTLMAGIAVAMLVMDWRLALAVFTVIPLLAWVSKVFQKRILGSSRLVRKTNSRLTASYNEGISGVRTSKVFVREDRNLEDFRRISADMYRFSVANALHSALYLPLVLALGSLATGLALAVGGIDVSAGRISIGTLIAFLSYTRHFFDPIEEMAYWFCEMQMAEASAERILGLIDAEPEIQDSPAVRARILEEGGPERIGEIRFEHVHFAYAGGRPVLEDFNLRVRPGETVALVGSTGGGKSTIVSLLCRFYEPSAGEILLDGTDYRERGLDWLQKRLGIVMQTPHLFAGTIADNIRYGSLEAGEDELVEAAKLVEAHDFIQAMPDGYRSEVGEGGVRLSTGQKQLVSFARAVLARPEILVMDEASSSIDTETEHRIQRGLARVLSGRTSFVIAHRLSTIRSADRILVIEKGRILEQGRHRELLAREGRYRELYTQQLLRDSSRMSFAE